jgi:FkbM family methyltransferase
MMAIPTKLKIRLANLISRALIPFVGNQKTVKRNGISWELDLTEAIDLSVFLFGRYQPHVLNQIKAAVPADKPVIVDVGGNVGAISLSLLKELPDATVYAFEPTDWAFGKFLRNVSLNPHLKTRLHLFQMFLNDGKTAAPDAVYASWNLNQAGETHVSHGGSLKSASKATSASLDAVISSNRPPAVHFIKIDTDGHEWDVLQGAKETLKTYKPVVLFEAGRDLWQEKNLTFSDFEAYFNHLGYELRYSNQRVTVNNEASLIPEGRTVDLTALPVV